jgi:HNH endonuclease
MARAAASDPQIMRALERCSEGTVLLDGERRDGAADVAELAVHERLVDGRREGADVAAGQVELAGAGDHDRHVVALRSETLHEILRRIQDDLGGLFHAENDPTGALRGRKNKASEGRVRTDFYIHPAKRQAVYLRNSHTCQCCGYHDETKTGENLSVEHITARTKGGDVQGKLDEPSTNLSTLCVDCNTLKNNHTPAKFNKLLLAKGATHGFDVSKLRQGSRRALDLETGAKLAAGAKAYRALNAIHLSAEAEEQEEKAEPVVYGHFVTGKEAQGHAGGPGIHRDEHGKFVSARLAVIRVAQALGRLLRARLGRVPG